MDELGVAILLIIIIRIYFLPSIIANKKKRKDRFWVFFTNLFIRWKIL